ncbi:hypothetical protein LG3211_5230 [Lysobacter gummosus]|nr:hypothetical protein LG3211_5230 [Lysobacter gummosus]
MPQCAVGDASTLLHARTAERRDDHSIRAYIGCGFVMRYGETHAR